MDDTGLHTKPEIFVDPTFIRTLRVLEMALLNVQNIEIKAKINGWTSCTWS
jgi:hypothetical protein